MITRIDIEDMTDAQDEAPERIWLEPGVTRPSGSYPPRLTWPDHPKAVEYIRADFARPSQAGDESVARLIEALKAMLGRHTLYCGGEGLPFAGHTDVKLFEMARAALAAMDTPKGGGDA